MSDIKVSAMTYLASVPNDAKIYIVKDGDTTPYYTTKADLLAGISGGTIISINGTLVDNTDPENPIIDLPAFDDITTATPNTTNKIGVKALELDLLTSSETPSSGKGLIQILNNVLNFVLNGWSMKFQKNTNAVTNDVNISHPYNSGIMEIIRPLKTELTSRSIVKSDQAYILCATAGLSFTIPNGTNSTDAEYQFLSNTASDVFITPDTTVLINGSNSAIKIPRYKIARLKYVSSNNWILSYTENIDLSAYALATDLATKADLVAGKVPSSQLPSYVDDILEFTNLASFPSTGETGKIYIALDTDKEYRWTGSIYKAITNGFIGSTSDVSEGTNLYFTTARVLATALSGLSLATGGTITSGDTILSAIGKLQYQISNLLQDATSSVKGIMKLYTSTGSNTDGSMTQKAVTDALNLKQNNIILVNYPVSSAEADGGMGTGANQIVNVATLGSDFINIGQSLEIIGKAYKKNVVTGSLQRYLYLNTSPNLTGSPKLFADFSFINSQWSMTNTRYHIKRDSSTTLQWDRPFNTSVGTDNSSSTAQYATLAIDFTQTWYLIDVLVYNGGGSGNKAFTDLIVKKY